VHAGRNLFIPILHVMLFFPFLFQTLDCMLVIRHVYYGGLLKLNNVVIQLNFSGTKNIVGTQH